MKLHKENIGKIVYPLSEVEESVLGVIRPVTWCLVVGLILFLFLRSL